VVLRMSNSVERIIARVKIWQHWRSIASHLQFDVQGMQVGISNRFFRLFSILYLYGIFHLVLLFLSLRDAGGLSCLVHVFSSLCGVVIL